MNDINNFIEYAPVIIVIILFTLQTKIFVTPETLEKKHREILNECQKRFASVVYIEELKAQWGDIKEKIDKIYDFFLKNQN